MFPCAASDAVPIKEGVVNFLVSDTSGKPIKAYSLEIQPGNREKSERAISVKRDRIKLPYGSYVVRCKASLHHWFEREFDLTEPNLLVTVALAARLHGERETVHDPLDGQVMGLTPGRGPHWIRIVSLLGLFMKEGSVEDSGAFRLEEVPLGDYIALVFKDRELLKIQRISHTIRLDKVVLDLP
jgi:hypothetical protein